MPQLRLRLDDMHCGSCVGRVERILTAQEGVTEARANLAGRFATIDYTAPAGTESLVQALKQAGFPPATQSLRLDIAGMSCAACVGRVERLLLAQPGVLSATVNLAARRADLVIAEGSATPTELAQHLSAAGFEAQLAQSRDSLSPEPASRDQAEMAALKRAFLIASALSLPVVLLEMTGHLIPAFHHWVAAHIGLRNSWLIQMALTAAVLAGPGRMFFAHGLAALRRGAPEMNTLVAVGAGSAFGFSTLVTLVPSLIPPASRAVYFEAAAVIVTLILLGRWLEARARGKAGQAIRALAGLSPDTAEVLREQGPVTLPLSEISPGDRLRIRPGARIPTDAELAEGHGWVDESMLTGEPLPVEKTPGDALTGGTLNGHSTLIAQVTATGGDTVLARIIAMVEDAQGAKLPVQALVDRVTRVFVPVVMGLSALTLILWLLFGPSLAHALVAAISVLIIACPCAMGLATPVSIMVGTGRGAALGLLFRRGDALQRLAQIRTVAFDKTGTLTEGHPSVTDILPEGAADQALGLAGALETGSEHPLARAILAEATRRAIPLPPATAITALPGRGLSGQVNGQPVLLGNRRALQEHDIDISSFSEPAARLAAEGKTPVFVAQNGQLIALIAVADPIKPTAHDAVRALHDLGIGTAMISGDTKATATAVGRSLGIDRITAEVLPEGKVAALSTLGADLAFVGDGLNDAPALAAADVGIALGTGTDVAIEAADLVLMQGDPTRVARAVVLSRAVMRNIRQNLFWAFAYNAALIPVAMGALALFGGPMLSPMLAAGAMSLSSVFVLSNALRLRNA